MASVSSGYTFDGPESSVLAISPTNGTLTPRSITWLKLNSTAPIHVEVEEVPTISDDQPFSGAKKLRYLLENTDELIVCPGVYDGLSARTAIELGFKSLYMVSVMRSATKCAMSLN